MSIDTATGSRRSLSYIYHRLSLQPRIPVLDGDRERYVTVFEGVAQDDRSPAAGSVIPRVSGV